MCRIDRVKRDLHCEFPVQLGCGNNVPTWISKNAVQNSAERVITLEVRMQERARYTSFKGKHKEGPEANESKASRLPTDQ